jgi:uncharacterized membrane protein
MPILIDFMKKTVLGGLLFLIPLAAVDFLVGKLVGTLSPVAHDLSDRMLGTEAIGPVMMTIALCLVLLALCFVAGLVAATVVGRKTTDWLEATLLSRVPGYAMVKNMAADAADNLARIEGGGRVKVVYVKVDEGWRLGFVTDQVSETLYAVFLPDAPSAFSGELQFLGREQFVDTDFTISEAIKCLARLGVRSRRGAATAAGSPF